MDLTDIIAILGAYFIGSISSSIILCHLAGLEDIRSVGSGNPGATNMLKTGSKTLAFLTLVGDFIKTYAPIAIAMSYLSLSATAIGLMCIASVLGHMFPLWHGFKGGKGVASCFASLLAVMPQAGLAWIVLWLATAGISRYSSVAGIIACASTPLLLFSMDQQLGPVFFAYLLIGSLVAVRHHSNIRKLINGTEDRIF